LEPITIQHGDQLTISAEFVSSAGGWWSADHFQLLYAPLPELPNTVTDSTDEPNTHANSQTTFYTLDGRQISTATAPGVYIKHENGITKKVWVH
ncbi:MAG: hypothetical protein K2H92_01780, partial [Bacteroidaceae bacterium]|nr:hypothetical protein [Bacteroidaceae bacterium]